MFKLQWYESREKQQNFWDQEWVEFISLEQWLMMNLNDLKHFPLFADSLPGHHGPCSPPEALPKPDVTQDSSSPEILTERDAYSKPKSVMERRKEGRYKTFDWAEFRPHRKPTVDADPQKSKAPCSLDLSDLERRKRREERRKRYESMLGFSLGWEVIGDESADGSGRALSPKSQQRMEEEMAECWKQVEKTVFRPEKSVPLYEPKDTVVMEKLLDSYRKGVGTSDLCLLDSCNRCF